MPVACPRFRQSSSLFRRKPWSLRSSLAVFLCLANHASGHFSQAYPQPPPLQARVIPMTDLARSWLFNSLLITGFNLSQTLSLPSYICPDALRLRGQMPLVTLGQTWPNSTFQTYFLLLPVASLPSGCSLDTKHSLISLSPEATQASLTSCTALSRLTSAVRPPLFTQEE